MGRRAKNKQGDPSPLLEVQENAGRPSQKKLGKRKADDVETTKRPAKKARESEGKPPKPSALKGKEKSSVKVATKAKSAKPKPAKQKQARFEDEDEGAGSSEGWEDVEDDGGLKAQAKYVYGIINY